MGSIVDRGREHLGPANKAIIQARRLPRQAAQAVADGVAPDGAGRSDYVSRANDGVLPREQDWRAALASEAKETILGTV